MEGLTIFGLVLLLFLVFSLVILFYPFLKYLKKQILFQNYYSKEKSSQIVNDNQDEEHSFSLNNSKIDSNQNQKPQNLTKKFLIYYYCQKVLFTYHSLLSLIFCNFKKESFYVFPAHLHLFFLLFSILLDFSIITIAFACESASFTIWFSFVLSFIVCFFMFIVITYYDFKFLAKQQTNGTIYRKKNSLKLYFENGIQELLIVTKIKTMDISIILLMVVLAVLFIISFFIIMFKLDNLYDPFIGLLISFLFDFFFFRFLLPFAYFFSYLLLKKPKTLEFLKNLYLNDQNVKKQQETFFEYLSKPNFKSLKVENDESKQDFKSTERLMLLNGSQLENEKGKQGVNDKHTFGNRNEFDDEEKNSNKNKYGNLYDLSSSNAVLLNSGNTSRVPVNGKGSIDGKLNEKTPSMIELEEQKRKIELEEEKRRREAEIEKENKLKKLKKIEESLSKVQNPRLKENLQEILSNSNENFTLGTENFIEETYDCLMKKNEIEEFILNEGSFYRQLKTKLKGNNNKEDQNGSTSQNQDKNKEKSPNGKQNQISTELEKSNKLKDCSEFAKDFANRNFSLNNFGMNQDNEGNIKFGEYSFVPNFANIRKQKFQIKTNKVYNSKDDSSVFEKMISPSEDNYLESVLNRIKPGLYSEIFSKISDKTLAKNLKKELNADVKTILKLKENYQIGQEKVEEGKFQPLRKENDFEEIVIPKGVFYTNKKLIEMIEAKKLKKGETLEKKSMTSTLKQKKNNNEWIKKFIKFSEESIATVQANLKSSKKNLQNFKGAIETQEYQKSSTKQTQENLKNGVQDITKISKIENQENSKILINETEVNHILQKNASNLNSAKLIDKNKKQKGLNEKQEDQFIFKNYIFIPDPFSLSKKIAGKNNDRSNDKDFSKNKIKGKMKDKKKKNLKQNNDLKSPNKGNISENDNENTKNKGLSPNENVDDLSPLDPKKQINQTCVKQDENMNEDEQNADLFDSKNPKSANLRKNKYKTPSKNKEINSSKISKLTSPKSGVSNANLSDKNNSNNGKLMNNFFDSDSKSKDPRLNRFKAKEKFLRKNNLSVNTKDPDLRADANISGSESAKNEQNNNNLEIMDLDSYANVKLAEAKKKAMLGFSKTFKYLREFFFFKKNIRLKRKVFGYTETPLI